MCLIIFKWAPGRQTPLILAANRDEFHQRPSLDAHFWDDEPNIFAGRDLEKLGTWLGLVTSNKPHTYKLAALTNFRSIDKTDYVHSRGEITKDFLVSPESALDYAKQIKFAQYAGFNGLFFDGESLVYCHHQKDQPPEIISLPAGTYGLSNAKLDTPWPKVQRTKKAFTELDENQPPDLQAEVLLTYLRNSEAAEDAKLPDTGVGIELERMLSPAFIISPNYGTRTSSVVIIRQNNKKYYTYFKERQFTSDGIIARELTRELSDKTA